MATATLSGSDMQQGLCLRIYLTESDRLDGKPALESILELCREAGLRGVSVCRGVEGMGLHGVHSSAFLSLSSNLPLIVEAIDSETVVRQALESMRPRLGSHLVATWPVSIMRNSEESDRA